MSRPHWQFGGWEGKVIKWHGKEEHLKWSEPPGTAQDKEECSPALPVLLLISMTLKQIETEEEERKFEQNWKKKDQIFKIYVFLSVSVREFEKCYVAKICLFISCFPGVTSQYFVQTVRVWKALSVLYSENWLFVSFCCYYYCLQIIYYYWCLQVIQNVTSVSSLHFLLIVILLLSLTQHYFFFFLTLMS